MLKLVSSQHKYSNEVQSRGPLRRLFILDLLHFIHLPQLQPQIVHQGLNFGVALRGEEFGHFPEFQVPASGGTLGYRIVGVRRVNPPARSIRYGECRQCTAHGESSLTRVRRASCVQFPIHGQGLFWRLWNSRERSLQAGLLLICSDLFAHLFASRTNRPWRALDLYEGQRTSR